MINQLEHNFLRGLNCLGIFFSEKIYNHPMNAQLDVKTFLVLKDLPRILKGRLIDEFIQKSQTQTFN